MERQAREFELLEPYLVDRWKALDAAEAAAADATGDAMPARPGAAPRMPRT